MPTVHNGIGTWYLGKDRINRHVGHCEFCGRQVELTSYDTTLFFVIIFIPIIPLGRKHVINQCSSCQRHRVLPLKKWNELQEKAMLETDREAMADPTNEQKAATAIGTAAGFDAKEECLLLARKYDAKFPRSPVVQTVLGDVYSHFDMLDEAQAAYEKSLAAREEPAVRNALAATLVRANRPAEALPHVEHIFAGHLADGASVLLVLAAGFEAQGMHEDAANLLDRAVATFPELANNSELKRLQSTAQKYRGTGRPVRGKLLKQVTQPTLTEGGLRARIPRLIPRIIVIGALAWYFGTAIKLGFSRPVHLVNGLERPYSVAVNGSTYRLGVHERKVVNVAEGDVTMRILDEATPIGPRNVSIRTPFFSRPFSNTVHVINPDGTAVLLRQQADYSPGGGNEPPPPEIHTGEYYYAIASVDYLFEPFPQKISMSSDASHVTKTRLDVNTRLTPLDLMGFMLGNGQDSSFQHLLRNRLELMPDDRTLLMIAAQILPPEQAEALFKSRLAARPLLIEWHRMYQEVSERAHPDYDLHGEYEKLLAADPENPELTYLLGRVTDDRRAAAALFAKASSAPKPVPYAFHAQAYDALLRAEFENALNLERTARRLDPKNPSFIAYEDDALMALKRYPELLAEIRTRQAQDAEDSDLVSEELYLLCAQGDVAGARRRASQYYELIRKKVSEQQLVDLRLEHDLLLAYVQNDRASYMQALNTMKPDSHALERALALRRFAEAETAMKKVLGNAGPTWALVYIAASEAQNAAAAESALNAMIAEYGKGDKSGRQFARWLKGDSIPTAQQIADCTLGYDTRRLALTALGLRVPAVRDTCFTMARQFNYDLRFPYLTIDKVTSGKP